MSRRRRAALLLGLALIVGGLAAADVSRRERALQEQLVPLVDVVTAKKDLRKGKQLAEKDFEVRKIPQRYAPTGVASVRSQLVGARLAVGLSRGGFFTPDVIVSEDLFTGPTSTRRGERAVEVIAFGSAEIITPGVRVDVLVTREHEVEGAGATLALQNVDVLSASAAPKSDSGSRAGLQRVTATLRVTPRQAVYLAAAEAGDRELRLLARAPDDRRQHKDISVSAGS